MRDLIERAKVGDHEAFSELASLWIDRLYAIARLILRDDDSAQDATQEALVVAWRDIGALRDVDQFDRSDTAPAWSPDGTRITFAQNMSDGTGAVLVMNADGSSVQQVTTTNEQIHLPSWSPDGTEIVFDHGPLGGTEDVYRMSADGTQIWNLTNDPANDWGADWAPVHP